MFNKTRIKGITGKEMPNDSTDKDWASKVLTINNVKSLNNDKTTTVEVKNEESHQKSYSKVDDNFMPYNETASNLNYQMSSSVKVKTKVNNNYKTKVNYRIYNKVNNVKEYLKLMTYCKFLHKFDINVPINICLSNQLKIKCVLICLFGMLAGISIAEITIVTCKGPVSSFSYYYLIVDGIFWTILSIVFLIGIIMDMKKITLIYMFGLAFFLMTSIPTAILCIITQGLTESLDTCYVVPKMLYVISVSVVSFYLLFVVKSYNEYIEIRRPQPDEPY